VKKKPPAFLQNAEKNSLVNLYSSEKTTNNEEEKENNGKR